MLNRYNKLVAALKIRGAPQGYFEKHHILPRSMGGSEDESNLVSVTAREHFILHKMLAKIYGGKMHQAFWLMCNVNSNKYSVKSRDFEFSRLEAATISSQQNRGENNPMYGRKGELAPSFGKEGKFKGRRHTEESKLKISTTLVGYEHSDEFKAKLAIRQTGQSNSFFGKTHTEEAKQAMREKLSGSNHPMYGKTFTMPQETRDKMREAASSAPKPKVACPHCGKEGGKPVMVRYHFENCRSKK